MLVKGDATYAAPEVLRHEQPDARADLFSLGLVLLELLTNRYVLDPPNERTPIRPTGPLEKLAHKLRTEEPSWAPPAELAARAERIFPAEVARVAAKVPSALQTMVLRALQPHPEDRYPSAAAMRDDLHAFLTEQAPYGGRELVEDLRHLIATPSGHRRDFEASREPIPAELRRKGTQRH
jgi:serine/threonine protein kinase